MTVSSKRLEKLNDPEYRHAYLKEATKGWVVLQLRTLREERGWTQADLAHYTGKSQPAIARIESESYGNWSTNTLLDLATAFDVALEIRFVSWPKFLKDTTDASPAAMSVASFTATDFGVSNAYQRPINRRVELAEQHLTGKAGLGSQETSPKGQPTPTPFQQGPPYPQRGR